MRRKKRKDLWVVSVFLRNIANDNAIGPTKVLYCMLDRRPPLVVPFALYQISIRDAFDNLAPNVYHAAYIALREPVI